ncbi:hypothetical protein OUS11_002763, partial [Enterococcus hirae]|nr:hypothetical protein [Enterococcus hirae]
NKVNISAKKYTSTVNTTTKKSVKDYAFYIVTEDQTYLSTKNGKLVVWKDFTTAAPSATVTIIKSNGDRISFDPSDETTIGTWVGKASLETGDLIQINAKQKWDNYRTSPLALSLANMESVCLEVNETGNLQKLTGTSVKLNDLTKATGNYMITYSYNGKSVAESLKVVAWSIDLKGYYDQLFAQLIDNGDHTATLHEYAVQPHELWNGIYSSIQV